MPPVLEINDLRAEFTVRRSTVVAVDRVSLSLGAGDCLGVVGESGCGKSTVALAIMRLLPGNGRMTGGSVKLMGRDLGPLSERQMRAVRGNDVALIPQDPMGALNPTLTIGRQIAEAVRLHRRVSKAQARVRAREVLGLVEMPRPEERLDQYPHQLSGGLRQRVLIAMALACEPRLLIADEPTTALDVTIQAQILDLIDDLRARLGMAVVLITHDMGVIAGRTDRVAVMYAGRIAEEAATPTLFRAMRHPYSAALLGSVPRLDADPRARLTSIPGLPPDLSQPFAACRFAPRCRSVGEACRHQEPELRSAVEAPSDATAHRVACFYPLDPTAPGDAGPAHAERWAVASGPEVSGDELLAAHHLVKKFPLRSGLFGRRRAPRIEAVADVSLSIGAGRTLGLVGESGCGKTTFGRLLVALDRPTSGSVRFGDGELFSLRGGALQRARRDLQFLFQDPSASLDPRMRVGAIIREPLRVQSLGSAREQRAAVRRLLGEVGLHADTADRYPHELSGGQRQRIGLARALALDPAVLVADEPVSALDVSVQAQILNLMKDLQARRQLTLVMISHDLAVVRYVADTIGVMYLGKLVELGPADAVYGDPVHPYTASLLAAVPLVDPGAQARRAAVHGELPSAADPPSGCRFRTRCPRASEVCAAAEPPLRAFGPGHIGACHLPLREPSGAGRR